MKEINQEEFEILIREIIQGKKSMAKAIKELGTESRTLNNEIQKLSVTNPELYKEFIKVRPYKPRERTDINIVGIVVEVLKTGITLEEISKKYDVGVRTISRGISKLKNSKDEKEKNLYSLYKSVASKRSHSQRLTIEEERKIGELKNIEIKRSDNLEQRRQELLELERRYQELCMRMGKEKAARELGMTSNRIYKLLNELYRMEIERNTREQEKDFKDGLKAGINASERKSQPNSQITQRKIDDHENTRD